MGLSDGAGEGNRTLVVSLEGFCSTIELHPRSPMPSSQRFLKLNIRGGEGWIRTNVGARPTDLQSAPFNHSGTPPRNSRLSTIFSGFGSPKPGSDPVSSVSRGTRRVRGLTPGVPALRFERRTYRLQGGCSTT